MTKSIRFSFHNTPAGLRMRNTHPIQSTCALSGINRVFTRLEQINKTAYEKVRHLDEFSVTLEQQPGSEKYGMRIFAEKVQIHIPNLKPETQKIFLELPPLPSAPPVPLSPDMMSSMRATVFPQNLLVSFATALSVFWNWIKSLRGSEPKKVSFAPDTKGEPRVPLEPNAKRPVGNPPAADPSPTASTASMRLPVIVLDQEPEAPMMEEALDTLPPSEMDRDPESDGEIYPENREYVDPASQKGQPFERMLQTPDAPLKHYSQPVLEPLPEPLLPLEQEAIKPPVACAASQEMKKKEGDLEQTKTAPPATAPDEPILTPPQFSATERQMKDLEFLFLMQLSPTETPDPSGFGNFLFKRIFPMNDLQSCEIDMTTGRFKLTFANEKTIPLTKLPESITENTKNNLKLAVGTTLHIGKELKGKINFESLANGKKDYLEFDEGSLTIQWEKLFKTWTAHLLGIRVTHGYSEWLTFKGKFMGKTAERNIRIQDFVDFIECNITK
jgi:hypothetical protein